MAGKPQQRTLATRRRILEAASRLIVEQGFDATSVDVIASEAGVAKATVFAHFADKASLLIALHLEQLENLSAAMEAEVEALAQDPARKSASIEMARLLSPWLTLYRENPEFARLFLVQSTLKDGPYTRQFLDACFGMEAKVMRGLSILSDRNALRSAADVAVLTQGVLAFYYHVSVGYNLYHTSTAAEQSDLMLSLLEALLERHA